MLAIAAIYLSLSGVPAACAGDLDVTPASMGPLALGEPMSAVMAHYDTSVMAREDDGNGEIARSVVLCQGAKVVATTDGKRTIVSMLSTASPLFLTGKGAHAGMTVAELTRLYPQGKLNFIIGEGLVANFDTGRGVIFNLDAATVPHRCYDPTTDCTAELQSFESVAVYIRKP